AAGDEADLGHAVAGAVLHAVVSQLPEPALAGAALGNAEVGVDAGGVGHWLANEAGPEALQAGCVVEARRGAERLALVRAAGAVVDDAAIFGVRRVGAPAAVVVVAARRALAPVDR